MNLFSFFRNRYVFLGAKIILTLILIICIGLGVKYILTSDKFKLKNIEIETNGGKSTKTVKEQTDKLLGNNIFSIRPKSIDEELIKSSVYIKSVITEKRLPDTLIIRIQEREPSFVMATLTGAYLLDNEGIILSLKPGYSQLELTDNEMDMLRGYASIGIESSSSTSSTTDNQSSLQTDNVVQVETEEQKAERIQAKKIELEENKLLIATRINAFWTNTIDLNDSFFKDQKIVYNYNREVYKVSDKINSELFSFSKQVLNYKWIYLQPKKFLWESNIKLVINTQEGTELVFSMNRKIEDQIYDLNAVLDDARFYNIKYSRIDLSTDKILVVET